MSESIHEREIFVEALNRAAGTERDEYLAEACAGEDGLRAQVERLLIEHSRPGPSFLDEALAPAEGTLTEEPSEWIDRYKLLQVIGEGGFGTVWMAEQKEPVRRKVALKIIKAGMDTKQVIARFEAERQALALMEHPSIAKVLDGGATKHGRPYFVMELVRGEPVTDYCDRAKLDTAGRLAIFREICHAVQHAHNKGVIHRDIKPSNVLVAESEGRAVPKVIDFGIAKATSSDLTQRTLFTEFRQFLGTPEYMAPEQAGQGANDIDTRADVYSLGVLLYELLTGTKPFDLKSALGAGWDEMLRIIREQEPPRPSTRISTMGDDAGTIAASRHTSPKNLGRLFKDDLDWIVLKALEKDRERRYATASGFAQDIDRFLAHEAVLASPPSRLYRLKKLATRNRKTFAFAGVFAAALLAGIIGTTAGMVRAIRAEKIAAHERGLAERQARIAQATVDFLNDDLLASVDPVESRGRPVTVREVLANAARTIETELANEHELEAAIRGTLGRTYLSLGDLAEAQRHLERTVSLDDEEHPSAQTLRARTLLAKLMTMRGELDEAHASLQQIVPQQTSLLGANHRDTLRSRHLAAVVLKHLARLHEAESNLLQLIEDTRASLGDPHRDLFAARSSLGDLYLRQGRLEEAETTFRELLQQRREHLSDDHPDTLLSLGAVADCLWKRKRFAEAEAVYREQLAIRRRVFGDEHPSTLAAMSSVATMLTNQNQAEAAESLHRKVLSTQLRVLGPDALATLVSTNNLAVALDRQGRYSEALELYTELGQRYGERYGPTHPNTLLSRNNTGAMLFRLGRLEEAETMSRDVLALRRQVHDPGHPRTMQSIERILEILRGQPERHEEARALQVEHLEYLQQRASHPESGLREQDLYAWELLIAIPNDLRDSVRAQKIVEEVLRQRGDRDPATLDTYAQALFQNGNLESAIEIQREAFERAPEQSTLRLQFTKRLAEMEAAAGNEENDGR